MGWCSSLNHSLPPTLLGGPHSHTGCSCLWVFVWAHPSASSLKSPNDSFFLPESLKSHRHPYQQLQPTQACIHLSYFIFHLIDQSLDLTSLWHVYQLLPCPLTRRHTCLTKRFTEAETCLSYSKPIVNKMQLTWHHLRQKQFLSGNRGLGTWILNTLLDYFKAL